MHTTKQIQTQVAIVGGGIAGLTAAYRLQQQGVDYCLIESEATLGGKIRTEHIDGFVVEGGPDSFLSQKPWARDLCQELGLASEIIGTNDAKRKTYLVSRGHLRPLPEGFVMLVPVKPLPLLRSRLISLTGILRMAIEPWIPVQAANGDESLGGFVRRRLGDEVLERIVDPLASGIYAGDSDHLSLAMTFPRLRELEQKHGSLIRGLLNTQQQMNGRSQPRQSMFLSLRSGLSQLVDALVNQLDPASILTGTRVVAMRHTPRYEIELTDGRILAADAVILATSALVSAGLLRDIDRDLINLLQQIPYVSTATISLGFRREEISHPLNGFGFIVPRVERRRITACTWVSTKMPHRAPDDKVLLRCFVGRAGDDACVGLSDAALVDLARNELRDLMHITSEPLFARIFRWEKAMPQYQVGHLDLLSKIDAQLAVHQGLFLTGSAYRGVGLPDCIREAGQVAQQAKTYLDTLQ